jgi:hypothetical protein
MNIEDLGEAFTALQKDDTLTEEQRKHRQKALMDDFFCEHLGPLPATCVIRKVPLGPLPDK